MSGDRRIKKHLNSLVNLSECLGKDQGIECNCLCQVSSAEEIAVSAISLSAGIAAAAGGVALTVMTAGGFLAIVGGSALVGAGSSMILNPIQRQISGERVVLTESALDIALGATIGAIAGPIGVGGTALAKGASSAVKLVIRAGVGAIAGGVSGTVSETARAFKGEEVSAKSFAKALGIGVLAGSVGGASTHIGGNLSSVCNFSEVGKAVTRVSIQASTAAATDASLQLIDKGEIDTKQLLLSTAGQLTVAATSEITQNFSKGNSSMKKANSQRYKQGIVFTSPKDIEAIMSKAKVSGSTHIIQRKNPSREKTKKNCNDYAEIHGHHRRLGKLKEVSLV